MARIIIADDDEIVGEIACDALIAGGHAAGFLKDGKDALAAIRAASRSRHPRLQHAGPERHARPARAARFD